MDILSLLGVHVILRIRGVFGVRVGIQWHFRLVRFAAFPISIQSSDEPEAGLGTRWQGGCSLIHDVDCSGTECSDDNVVKLNVKRQGKGRGCKHVIFRYLEVVRFQERIELVGR